MTDFRDVTPEFAVSPQITPADVAFAAARGFGLIINNRPDGEAPGQPTSGEILGAARSAGLDYVHIPITGRPNQGQVDAMRQSLGAGDRKTLAFCRSGTRSITTWALGAGLDRDKVLSLASAAGYDLSGVI